MKHRYALAGALLGVLTILGIGAIHPTNTPGSHANSVGTNKPVIAENMDAGRPVDGMAALKSKAFTNVTVFAGTNLPGQSLTMDQIASQAFTLGVDCGIAACLNNPSIRNPIVLREVARENAAVIQGQQKGKP